MLPADKVAVVSEPLTVTTSAPCNFKLAPLATLREVAAVKAKPFKLTVPAVTTKLLIEVNAAGKVKISAVPTAELIVKFE